LINYNFVSATGTDNIKQVCSEIGCQDPQRACVVMKVGPTLQDSQNPISSFGAFGSGRSEFFDISGIALWNSSRILAVSDGIQGNIELFSADTYAYLGEVDGLTTNLGISFDELTGALYVAERDNDRILKCTIAKVAPVVQ
jgi:hypothetical protein